MTAVANTTGTQTENGAKDARDARPASTDLTTVRGAPAMTRAEPSAELRPRPAGPGSDPVARSAPRERRSRCVAAPAPGLSGLAGKRPSLLSRRAARPSRAARAPAPGRASPAGRRLALFPAALLAGTLALLASAPAAAQPTKPATPTNLAVYPHPTVNTHLLVTWDRVPDVRYDLRYFALVSGNVWYVYDVDPARGTTSNPYIVGYTVKAGQTYSVSVRAVGQGGAKSDWTTAHAVAGAPVPSPATLTLSVANRMVEENVGTVRVTAALDNPAGANGVNVTLSTRGTAARAGAVASGREDYRLTPDVLEIRVGATTGTATVSIVDDTTGELDETIILSATTATSSITNITGTTITIRDNDGGPPSPPPPPPPVPSSEATLRSLAFSAGWLAFAPETRAYAVAVPYAVNSLTATPTARDGAATVRVNGVSVESGEASAAIALAVGETVIEVVVAAASGATRTYRVTVTRGPAEVALLPAASGTLHGFVRVVNESSEAGTVTVRAFDDAGTEYGPVTLAIGAGEARHFNATDLESGNPDKGLSGSTGPGQGHWRLVFESELGLRVLGYVRTREAEGFPNAVHDVVAESRPSAQDYRYEVAFFNPASNPRQASVLRLVNRSDAEAAEVTITGTDDAGRAGEEAVTLTLPAGAARTLSAPALESGEGEGLDGMLGDGAGKWRLAVDSDRPLGVMSLMGSLDGHLTNLSTAPGGVERLWLLPSAADTVRYGFVRVVNEGGEAGEVQIRAFDDTGEEHGPLTLALEAGAAVQLGSRDLESGNADKGLTGATGPGQGRWRLAFERDPGVRVYGYVRNHGASGFPAAVHDAVAESASDDGYRYEVAFFNPASNANQASVLRLVNRSASEEATVTITGTDDAGRAGDAAVTLTLPAGASRRLSAPALESGDGEGLDGMLGDGAGKWRLTVASDRPLGVMSLMSSPEGHLTNLSTAPPASRTKRR